MQLYNVLLNNKIPFVLVEDSQADNVIYCTNFTEHFFGVGEFATRTQPVILEYTTENNVQYITTSVTLENGICFNNVKFKVVLGTEAPYSTVNFSKLTEKEQVEFVEEQPVVEEEIVIDQPPVYIPEPLVDTKKEHEEITLNALRTQYPENLDLRGAYFGKAPVLLLVDNTTENTLYCKSLHEYLFNVGLFSTKTKDVILEYTLRGNDKYAITDVVFENGECYRNVKFRVVVADTIETPFSTINVETLGRKEIVPVPQEDATSQEIIEEPVPEIKPTELKAEIDQQKKIYQEAINRALIKEQQLEEEKEKIKRQRLLLENKNIIEGKIEQYKEQLLEEYFNATQRQSDLLNIRVDEKLETIQKTLEERVSDTFNSYSEFFEKDELQKLKVIGDNHETRLNLLLKKIDESIDKNKQVLSTHIEKRFASKEAKLREALDEKSKQVERAILDKNLIELEKYREKLLGNFEVLSNVKVEELLSEKGAEFIDQVKTINNKIDDLLKEKSTFAIKGKFTPEQEKYITETARYWARRILDLGGGGGTVAVQYAKGGIIDGPLTVTGALTVNDIKICGDVLPCVTDVHSLGSPELRWKDLHISGDSIYIGDAAVKADGTTIVFPQDQITKGDTYVSGGSLDVTFGGKYLSAGVDILDVFVLSNSPIVQSTYTTVKNFSGGWQQAYEQLAATTSIINYLSGQIDLNVFQNINSSYETIYDFVANPHANVYSGYTVTLVNKRVYAFAGTDQNNAMHYLEINANPMKPVYVEQTLDNNGVVVDLYNLTDFRSAKYTLQVQTSFNNEIYYSEINTVGAVGTMQSEAVEYGQLYTSQLIDNYMTYIQGGKLYLSATFIRPSTSPSDKFIIKGLRTNFYKI